jgi:hypothetical protein
VLNLHIQLIIRIGFFLFHQLTCCILAYLHAISCKHQNALSWLLLFLLDCWPVYKRVKSPTKTTIIKKNVWHDQKKRILISKTKNKMLCKPKICMTVTRKKYFIRIVDHNEVHHVGPKYSRSENFRFLAFEGSL